MRFLLFLLIPLASVRADFPWPDKSGPSKDGHVGAAHAKGVVTSWDEASGKNIQYEGNNFILDTKWKVLKSKSPSDNDLKQMYVYNHYFNAQKSMLLYPKVFDNQENKIGNYQLTASTNHQKTQCNVYFLEIVQERSKGKYQLNPNLGLNLLNLIRVES